MKARILRLDIWIDQYFHENLREQPCIELSVMKPSTPNQTNWAMLAKNDIVSLHCPRNQATLDLFERHAS